jgi:hypothetical protein
MSWSCPQNGWIVIMLETLRMGDGTFQASDLPVEFGAHIIVLIQQGIPMTRTLFGMDRTPR